MSNTLVPIKLKYDSNMHSDTFEKAKREIEEFSKQLPKNYSLPSVETDKEFGEFFGDFIFGRGLGFDHQVTGEELNKIVSKIGSILCDINDVEIKLVQEFGTLYKALDALDKDYIEGIVSALEENKIVSNALAVTQNNLEQTVQQQAEALRKIVLFKNEVELFKQDMEVFRNKAKERIGILKKEYDKQSLEISQIISNFQSVESFMQGIDGQLRDVDSRLKSAEDTIQSMDDRISDYSSDMSDIKNNIVELENTISEKEQSIESIKRMITNVQDRIDSDTKDFLTVQDKVDGFVEIIHTYKNDINGVKNQTDDLSTQTNDLNIKISDLTIQTNESVTRINHLSTNIDTINSAHTHQEDLINRLTQNVDDQLLKVNEHLQKSDIIQEHTNNLEKSVHILENEIKGYQSKVTQLTYTLYAGVGLSIISCILALMW